MVDVPPASTAPRPQLRQGIYLLPSLFTLANLGLGFFSMIKTVQHSFGVAATCILVCHILDILDGRVARWSRSESKFGVELDSMADWMSFGVAPAFMMYELLLKDVRPWGFPVALFFVICGALRLVRFNLKAHMGESKTPYFVGLPIPAAGGALAIFALLYEIVELEKPANTFKIIMSQVPHIYNFVPAIMVILSLLMVSEVRYSTFKGVNLLKPRSMHALVLTLLTVLMMYSYPQNTIFILYSIYIVWGLIDYFWPGGGARGKRPESITAYEHDTYGK